MIEIVSFDVQRHLCRFEVKIKAISAPERELRRTGLSEVSAEGELLALDTFLLTAERAVPVVDGQGCVLPHLLETLHAEAELALRQHLPAGDNDKT